MNNYIDATVKWIRESKPKKGNIKFLNYSITQNGERIDSSNGILDISINDDFYIGTWFKNNIWGNCRFQPAIVFPHKKRSADLRIFGKCSLVEEQTIEIKTITSNRRDGLVFRLKEANGQSSNILIDVTNFPYDENTIKKSLIHYFVNHDWIRLIAVKNDNNLLFVWQKI